MMRIGRTDQLWIAGGVLGAAVLLVISWFFLISPQHAQTGTLNGEAAAADQRLTSLQQRIAGLRKKNDELAQYQAQLARDRQALPTTSGLSDLLRELQVAGDATGVSVSGLNVGAATPVKAGGAGVYALPLSLTATGAVDKLNNFLDQLQQVQPRALLISGAAMTLTEQAAPSSGAASLTLTLQAFVSGA